MWFTQLTGDGHECVYGQNQRWDDAHGFGLSDAGHQCCRV